jgi:hypothetical protein
MSEGGTRPLHAVLFIASFTPVFGRGICFLGGGNGTCPWAQTSDTT